MTVDNTSRPVALVTGAARRIGSTIARMLHDRGYNVAIHFGNSRIEAETLAAQLNARVADSADIFQADLRELAPVNSLADQVKARWGRVNTLVNNASTFYPTPFANAGEADWDTLLDSNLKGPYFLTRALADMLTQNRGTVINITDINTRYPLKDYSIYCIAKAGMAMMTRSLARELAPAVRVNAVGPGSILWPEGDAAMTDKAKQKTLEKIPLHRLGAPEEVAELVCFLAQSPGYITGQMIAVDGGLNLNGDQG